MLHPPVFPALHPVFEALGYFLGYAAYKHARRNIADPLTDEQRWSVIAAAAVGALAGSRVLGVAEQLPRLRLSGLELLHALVLPGGGKTIVGGLLGGWIAVELVKKVQGIHTRTGDLFAIPLCLGIAVGRVGCFVAGIADDTYGKPTSLPWATDFGDGIGRHPTQVYEILFLGGLALVLHLAGKRPHRDGALFRIFLAAYLAWRLLIDFLKPQPLTHGLNAIQWACVAGLAALAFAASLPSSRSSAAAGALPA